MGARSSDYELVFQVNSGILGESFNLMVLVQIHWKQRQRFEVLCTDSLFGKRIQGVEVRMGGEMEKVEEPTKGVSLNWPRL